MSEISPADTNGTKQLINLTSSSNHASKYHTFFIHYILTFICFPDMLMYIRQYIILIIYYLFSQISYILN